jgi:hypothetical protein
MTHKQLAIKESATVLPSCNSEVASDQLPSFKLFAAVNKSFTACSVSGLSSVARAYILKPTDKALDSLKTELQAASLIRSPLTLDLDGDGMVETTSKENSGVYFDHDNNSFAEQSGWVGKDDSLRLRLLSWAIWLRVSPSLANWIEPSLIWLLRLIKESATVLPSCNSEVASAPLTLDLDGDGMVETTSKKNSGVYFDHDNNSFAEQSGWVDKDIAVFDELD